MGDLDSGRNDPGIINARWVANVSVIQNVISEINANVFNPRWLLDYKTMPQADPNGSFWADIFVNDGQFYSPSGLKVRTNVELDLVFTLEIDSEPPEEILRKPLWQVGRADWLAAAKRFATAVRN